MSRTNNTKYYQYQPPPPRSTTTTAPTTTALPQARKQQSGLETHLRLEPQFFFFSFFLLYDRLRLEIGGRCPEPLTFQVCGNFDEP